MTFFFRNQNKFKAKGLKSYSTSNVHAAVRPLLADSGRMLLWNVHPIAAKHITGGDGSLWQIAVGGMCAVHWPFVEHEPEENKDSIDMWWIWAKIFFN